MIQRCFRVIHIFRIFYCLLFFLFICSSPIVLEGAKSKPIKYDEVISLGGNCEPAIQLRKNHMRMMGYPFDWMFTTSVQGLIEFIQNKGAGFLDHDQLALSTEGGHHAVTDLRYGFTLIHDFTSFDNFQNDYLIVKEKYDRRIKRFFELLESNKEVLFIRLQIPCDQCTLLDHVIHTQYPNLSYEILALNHAEEADWGLERVKNVYLKNTPYFWASNEGDISWKKILHTYTKR
jgi:Putative papain-like cysteine peptidase (DUF1796)